MVRQRCHKEGLGLVSVTVSYVVSRTDRLDKRLLNSCVYGHLFGDASPAEVETLSMMGHRWKQYEKEGKWKYEGHSSIRRKLIPTF